VFLPGEGENLVATCRKPGVGKKRKGSVSGAGRAQQQEESHTQSDLQAETTKGHGEQGIKKKGEKARVDALK